MRLRAGDLALAVVALAIVVLLSLAQGTPPQPSTYSSYDTGPNGYRAVYEVMRREGLSVTRLESDLGTLHDQTATLVLSPNISPSGTAPAVLDNADAARLADFVRGGGRIVVLGDALPQAALKDLKLPSQTAVPATSEATRSADVVLTNGVTRVRGPFTDAFNVPRRDFAVTLLLTVRGGATAIAYPLGRGDVLAVTSPGIFSNAQIANDDNARFAYNLLSSGGTVVFDETLHGYTSKQTVWQVLPASVHDAVWIVLAILLIAIIGGIFRSAPPVALQPRGERDSSAYVASMAALLRRARAGHAAVERFAEDALRHVQDRGAMRRSSEIAAQLEELQQLRKLGRPDDGTLLEAARLNVRLRKELGAAR